MCVFVLVMRKQSEKQVLIKEYKVLQIQQDSLEKACQACHNGLKHRDFKNEALSLKTKLQTRRRENKNNLRDKNQCALKFCQRCKFLR